MILNIILVVLLAVVAYFHYAQGLFTATLSAALCALAALMAVGYHETLAQYLMKFPDSANSIALALIFSVGYVVPRLLFDKLVPGNVQFPPMLDKVGAGLMGVVAGLFATGVFALAAQSLGFGPSIGGFTRQDLQNRDHVVIPGGAGLGASLDAVVTDELVGSTPNDPDHASHLWLHQDEILLALAKQQSDGGTFAGPHTLESAHPDYLTELYAQRLGSPVGAKRSAVNSDKQTLVKVAGAYSLAKAPETVDGEVKEVRGSQALPPVPKPAADNALVVVQVNFSNSPDLADTDQYLRFSPASLRLQAGGADYYPIGTMVGRALLVTQRVDDPMIVDLKTGSQTVDFVFVLNPNDALTVDASGKQKVMDFKEGSFIEFKRYGRQALDGVSIVPQPPPGIEGKLDPGLLGGVMRKRLVGAAIIDKLGKMSVPGLTTAPS